MADAPRDENRVPTAMGVSSSDLTTPTPIYVDPTNGAIVAEVTGAGSGDVLGPATNTDGNIPQWDGADSKTLKDGLTFSTDAALGTSDATVSSQKAVKAYADTKEPALGNPGVSGQVLSSTDAGVRSWTTVSSVYNRAATKVVAASDSADTTNADYVCDGADDDVQIQAAIDALPATGGRVVLMEGNFSIGTAIDIDKNGVTLEGQGKGTIMKIADNKNITLLIPGSSTTQFYNTTIRDIYFDGNGANQASGGIIIDNNNPSKNNKNVIIKNCYFTDSFGDAIINYEFGMIIDSCHFINNRDNDISGNQREMISNCYFSNTRTGNSFVTSVYSIINSYFFVVGNFDAAVIDTVNIVEGNSIVINGNLGSNAIVISSCDIVSKNNIQNNGTANIASRMVNLGNTIVDNIFTGGAIGVNVFGATYIIKGNTFNLFSAEAIKTDDLSYSVISDNTMWRIGVGANDTYAAILLAGAGSTYNTITGNVIYSTIAANKHKYGIREDTTSDGPNIITNNICLNAVTANISAQHASTIVANNIEV